jgi:hypothetical protein
MNPIIQDVWDTWIRKGKIISTGPAGEHTVIFQQGRVRSLKL